MSRIKIGLQLYTLRELTEKDFFGTLEKVAEIGYEAVEFAGYGGIEAKEMKQKLDQLGLEAVSSHVPMHLLETELERQIEYSLEIGAKFIMCPYLDFNTYFGDEDKFKQTLEKLQQIGETLKQHHLQFGYHNHDFEFKKLGDRYVLDRLYESIPADLLVAELDLYWVKKAGVDPQTYLEQYKGRTPLIHLKDMTGDGREFFAEVGQGIIDYKGILETASANGVQYGIVEQDQCEQPPLESVKMSFDYLKSIGVA